MYHCSRLIMLINRPLFRHFPSAYQEGKEHLMSRNPTALHASQVAAGTLALLATSIALANQDAVRLADTVVTAAGFEQKITDAPASISVISQEDLRRNRYSNLAQALDGVEGVDIRQGTGKTGGLNISLRGMPSEYTLILIDGRRQNPGGDVTPTALAIPTPASCRRCRPSSVSR